MSPSRFDPHRESRLREVCDRIGYDFEDLGLLHRALCHSSLGNEGLPNYERLEFLGDAVLGFLVAERLYEQTPEIPEGELTSRRSLMVSRAPLAEVAEELDLGSYLLVGRGLTDENIRSPRILADLVEAVLAAIYLDSGVGAARRFVHEFVIGLFQEDRLQKTVTDAKTRLNQWAQSHDVGSPSYKITHATGPDHDPTFRVSVTLDGITTTSSEVKSKQAGEQEAAAQCLQEILAREDDDVAADASSDDDDIQLVWD